MQWSVPFILVRDKADKGWHSSLSPRRRAQIFREGGFHVSMTPGSLVLRVLCTWNAVRLHRRNPDRRGKTPSLHANAFFVDITIDFFLGPGRHVYCNQPWRGAQDPEVVREIMRTDRLGIVRLGTRTNSERPPPPPPPPNTHTHTHATTAWVARVFLNLSSER